MPKITGPWTYRTPLATIEYGDGEHMVSTKVADAYKAELKDQTNGDEGLAEAGAAGGTGKAQG